MRICLAHNRYQRLGGEDLAARAEMELLQRHGQTVDLFDAGNARILGFAGKVKAGLGVVYSPDARKKLATKIASFRPDVVQVHNFFPLLSPSIYYACREAGVPVVQTLHNYRLMCPSALLMRGGRVCEDCVGKSVPWPGVLHACYRGSRVGSAAVAAMIATHRFWGSWENVVDAYIARTNFSRNKLVAGGLPVEKITVIPSFSPDPGNMGGGSGRFALFVGRLSLEKGVETLLAAWSRLRGSIPLKVAGDGPLQEEVKRHAAEGRIEYLGTKRHDTILELMREAELLIFPSRCYENFPLVIVEAFACGLPVVASQMGAMGEVIEHGRTGLHFRPGDAEDLAAKVEWAMGHPKETSRMRSEARAEYLAKYTPEHYYEMLMQLYDCVTHGTMGQKQGIPQAEIVR